MEYTSNIAGLKIHWNYVLHHDSYWIPFRQPLVIQKSVADPIPIKEKDVTVEVVDRFADPLLALEEEKNQEKLLSSYQQLEQKVDTHRLPWLRLQIVTLLRTLGRPFEQLAYQYSEEHPDAISFHTLLANHYRFQGDLPKCYHTASSAISKKGLFWESRSRLMEEIGISAYYSGDYRRGYMANEYLCLHPDVDNKQHVKNRYFYALKNRLPYINAEKYDITTRPVSGSVYYKPCNPSVITDEQGSFGTIRAVNYIRNGDAFDFCQESPYNVTINYLVEFDENKQIKSQKEMNWTAPIKHGIIPGWQQVKGIEDIRLIDRRRFLAVIPEMHRQGRPNICMCYYDFQTGDVERIIPVLGRGPDISEKNWLPFLEDGEIKVLYSYQPFVIYTLNDDGEKSEIHQKNYNINLSEFRGSAPPIPYTFRGESGYLFVIHENIMLNCWHYFNRVVWMDSKMRLRQMGPLFRFKESNQIEFISGLTNEGSKVSFWLGVNDREVWRYDVSNEEVDKHLDVVKINEKGFYLDF